jgi:glycosyltransferase involved in cell wall biosynthesis
MTRKLYYGGVPGEGYGWGTCHKNLIRELAKTFQVIAPCPTGRVDGPVFMEVADHQFNPVLDTRGTRNIGYAFFELPLGAPAVENAKQYDLIFVGSTWGQKRCRAIGINNTEVLIQGVDKDVFCPDDRLPPPKEFAIFSGGKFELRKGQDIVLAAFKKLQGLRPDARLVTCWANVWPEVMDTMAATLEIQYPKTPVIANAQEWRAFMRHVCDLNEIDHRRIEFHWFLDQAELADIMRRTSVGIFPNRCEGGTNLMLMEYQACGRPVIMSPYTGHLDVLSGTSLKGQIVRELDWFEADVSDCVEKLLEAYEKRPVGGGHRVFTWEAAAKKIAEKILGRR